ncbi:amidohydrolase [Aspergillus sclerotioniger CBS 115572]|uniref:Amidohydrolase n=1 Tax=Aspergillus sclerotioniger CBS 115572 TaxID=1450535 RepID=A0A317W9E2_9EURO|nr:amidohydrolase [Aspergillus sclerotioniger CBS 115572]PWY80730.1 amidohydrolase [Aspergillus sclerotioniger CBS 115572]
MADFTIHTSSLFDPQIKRFRSNVSVTVNPASGLIVRVFERDDKVLLSDLWKAGDIDLRGRYVLPGLVDAHTHIFLHSYDEAGALQQKRDESIGERMVRAVNHCRTALLAGYTTYRDLGSEGMQEFDANIRDAVARGLTPGPRLFVATRVLASTGSYESRTENSAGGHCLPSSADAVDGIEACRQAVRRRIAAGADIIKFFADYRRRIMRYPPAQQHPYIAGVLHPPKEPNPDYMVFSKEEMQTIVAEARLARCPVSAHCATLEGAMAAIDAGVNTIEHAYLATDKMLKRMVERNVILVPTLAIAERLHGNRFEQILSQVKRAHELGVRLACGGDTGTYPHGENVRELELMMKAGVPVVDVLEACTVGGWEACGGDLCGRRFGWFEAGAQADIIALDENPEVDPEALRTVEFVMKDARVWKHNGQPMGML